MEAVRGTTASTDLTRKFKRERERERGGATVFKIDDVSRVS